MLESRSLGYQMDYGEILVVVLMMRSFWVVFVFEVLTFWRCLFVVTSDLGPSLSLLTRARLWLFSFRLVA